MAMSSLQQHVLKPTTTQHEALSCTRVNTKEAGENIYGIKYSPDGTVIAATFGNGCVRLFDAASLAALPKGKVSPQHDDVPSTSVKFSPSAMESGKYDLATASSGGAVYGWHWDRTNPHTATILDRVWRINEEGNDTASLDYSPDGAIICSGGSDRKIRVYDAEARKMTSTLERGYDDQGHGRPAHTNRIFSVRFASQTTLLSGGWETPVQVWDMRTGKSERQLSGPQVSSDSIEIIPGTTRCLIGSNRNQNQLQMFDFISGREIVEDSTMLTLGMGRAHVVTARLNRGLLWAVTSKPDAIMCVDATTGEVKGIVDQLEGQVLCADASPCHPTKAVFGGMKETIYVVDFAPE